MKSNIFSSTILHLPAQSPHQEAVIQFTTSLFGEIPNHSYNWYFSEETAFSIETVRTLISDLAFATGQKSIRVAALLKIDTASPPAQNALLKILEEPPTNTKIILTVNNPHFLLPTILSRCLLIEPRTFTNLENYSNDSSIINDAQQIFDNFQTLTHTQAIECATTYKKKEEATALLSQLLTISHQQLTNQVISSNLNPISPGKLIKIVQQLQLGYDRLQKNINVRLTLEDCFFKCLKIAQ